MNVGELVLPVVDSRVKGFLKGVFRLHSRLNRLNLFINRVLATECVQLRVNNYLTSHVMVL